MAKISIGLRGWRFDESEVFDSSGELRPLDEIPEDARYRLLRLTAIVGEPCDACWLASNGDNPREMDQAKIVYGEPVAEVLLCTEHEVDFLYWFKECGGEQYTGGESLPEQFHQWFDDGGRAPMDYEGVDHIDRDPESLPDPSNVDELDEIENRVSSMSDMEQNALDVDLEDLDM